VEASSFSMDATLSEQTISTNNKLELESRSRSGPQVYKRLWVFLAFICLFIGLYILMYRIAPKNVNGSPWPFLPVWWVSFVPYFAACLWVYKTKPLVGRGFWLEMGLILGGALLFRAILLPHDTFLSGDVWRYVWDGKIGLLGYNPYTRAPGNPIYAYLTHDGVFANTRYRNIPSPYPPMAQYIYMLGALLTSTSILGIKSIWVAFDLGITVVLALFLARRGLDPRRCILYAWCPLPIVEFAINGHVDVLLILLTLLAVYCATFEQRNLRIWAGIFLGAATLVKFYPILLLIALVRRRDWPMVLACVITCVVGYLYFLITSDGQPLLVLRAPVYQASGNPSVLPYFFSLLQATFMHTRPRVTNFVFLADALVLLPVSIMVVILRLKNRISMELAVLLLIGSVLSVTSYFFTWYGSVFLPWLALLLGSGISRQRWSKLELVLLFEFVLTCALPISYILGLVVSSLSITWQIYFYGEFGAILIGWLLVLLFVAISPENRQATSAVR
jgi:hypothetical protein